MILTVNLESKVDAHFEVTNVSVWIFGFSLFFSLLLRMDVDIFASRKLGSVISLTDF